MWRVAFWRAGRQGKFSNLLQTDCGQPTHGSSVKFLPDEGSMLRETKSKYVRSKSDFDLLAYCTKSALIHSLIVGTNEGGAPALIYQ